MAGQTKRAGPSRLSANGRGAIPPAAYPPPAYMAASAPASHEPSTLWSLRAKYHEDIDLIMDAMSVLNECRSTTLISAKLSERILYFEKNDKYPWPLNVFDPEWGNGSKLIVGRFGNPHETEQEAAIRRIQQQNYKNQVENMRKAQHAHQAQQQQKAQAQSRAEAQAQAMYQAAENHTQATAQVQSTVQAQEQPAEEQDQGNQMEM